VWRLLGRQNHGVGSAWNLRTGFWTSIPHTSYQNRWILNLEDGRDLKMTLLSLRFITISLRRMGNQEPICPRFYHKIMMIEEYKDQNRVSRTNNTRSSMINSANGSSSNLFGCPSGMCISLKWTGVELVVVYLKSSGLSFS
jgi:hypothetical protein